jgi:hypothetical protein
MLFCTSILAASALAASSGPWPVVPIRWDLGPIAQRIAHEDCRLTIIGDSNSSRETSPRMLGGMMRTWRPDRWVGRVAPAVASSNEGVRIQTSDAGFVHTIRHLFDVNGDDPQVWSNGQDGFVPNRGWDIVTDGSGLSGATPYTFTTLTRMDEYVDGDWTTGHPMRARLVFARDPSGMPQLSYQAHRGGVTGDPTTFSPEDSADRTWIDWVDVDVPDGIGIVGAEVRSPVDWLHEQAGGPWPCPANCEVGQSFFHVTQVLWRTDAAGLQIDAIAEAGFQAVDHLAEGDQYDDEALQRYLAATRDPNVFLVLLGQNMSGQEHEDIEGIWRSHVEGVLDRYRAACLFNDPDADPLFLLVAPWHTGNSTDRFIRMAATLHQIAMERVDSGFINLFALAGSFEHNRGVHLESHGVHFRSDSGADYFNTLIWNQIERELAGHQDLLLPGDIDELTGMILGDESAIHVMPGTHVGGVTITGQNVLVRGWDATSSMLVPPVTGGATLRVMSGASLQLDRMNVIGGVGEIDAFGQARGGAVAISGGEVRMSNGVLQGGETDLGGVVFVEDGLLELDVMRIETGHATVTGGLIYAKNSTLRIDGSALVGGTAATGGGLSLQGGVLEMKSVTVLDCLASGQGGGLYFAGTDADVLWTTVRGCEASDGAGLWAQGGGVVVAGSRFMQNDADVLGGGIDSIGKAVMLLSTDICGNSPDQVAGTFVDLGGNVIETKCPCPTDFNGDGVVGVTDLLLVVTSWGPCDVGCEGDANDDNVINADDLLMVISGWGACL